MWLGFRQGAVTVDVVQVEAQPQAAGTASFVGATVVSVGIVPAAAADLEVASTLQKVLPHAAVFGAACCCLERTRTSLRASHAILEYFRSLPALVHAAPLAVPNLKC